MNAPEGQSLQRDNKLQMKKRDAARLYLNLLECYFIFVSFFSFPFSFAKKILLFSHQSKIIWTKAIDMQAPDEYGDVVFDTKVKHGDLGQRGAV